MRSARRIGRLALVATVFATVVLPAGAQAGWETPVRIDGRTPTSFAPVVRVAAGATGAATLIWEGNEKRVDPLTSSTSLITTVKAASAPAGGTFGQPVLLSPDPATTVAAGPRVATDAAGRATAVFTVTGRSTPGRVVFAPPVDGSVFGPMRGLSGALLLSSSPAIAVSPHGHAIALWQTSDGLTQRLQASYRRPGADFGLPVTLTPPSPESPALTGLAISPSGRAAATYSLGGRAFVHWVDAQGAFRRRLRLAPTRQIATAGPARFGAEDTLVVLFTSRRGAVKYGVVAPDGRRIQDPRVLARAGAGPVLNRGAEADSRLVAAWTRDAGTIQVSVGSPDGRLGAATALFDPIAASLDSTSGVAVSSNARGDAVIAWRSFNGLMAAVQPAGREFARPQLVSVGDRPGTVSSPTVAMDAAGNVIAAWGTGDAIKAARYTPVQP
jgi:hypothetical protein